MFESIFNKKKKDKDDVNISDTLNVESKDDIVGDASNIFDDDFYSNESAEQFRSMQESQSLLEDDDLYGGSSFTNINNNSNIATNNNAIEDDLYSVEEKDNEEEELVIDDKAFKETLKQISRRGNSFVVTGCSGAGTSTVALNISYLLNKLGYSVLLVDLDTEKRCQHYLSKDNFDSLDVNSDNIKNILCGDINSIHTKLTISRRNLHYLGSGIGCEPYKISDIDEYKNIYKISDIVKREYDFVVWDIPINTLINEVPDMIQYCDDLVLTIDGSNWGVLSTINTLCNIENEHILGNFFSDKTNIVFNRFRGTKKIFDKNINLLSKQSTSIIDRIVRDLAECDIGYHFSDMRLVGCIPFDSKFESCIGNKSQYCDMKVGKDLFINIIKNIVVKR